MICRWFISSFDERQSSSRSRYNGRLARAWTNIVNQAYDGDNDVSGKPRSLSCSTILNLLRSEHPQFAENRQNDAHEFLRYFLDGLSSDCNRVSTIEQPVQLDDKRGENPAVTSERFWKAALLSERSIVTDMFSGQMVTRIICLKCRNIRHRFDNFLDISLELDGSYSTVCSLEDLLQQAYINAHEVRDLDCPFCQKRCPAEIRSSLWRLPEYYLFIHIKRFKWEIAQGGLQRVNASLSLPERGVLEMEKFCPFSDHPSVQQATFFVDGVVSQSGTADSGHYTAFAAVGREWFIFNDERVSVAKQPVDGRSIYLLICRRIGNKGRSSPNSTVSQMSTLDTSAQQWAEEEKHQAQGGSSSANPTRRKTSVESVKRTECAQAQLLSVYWSNSESPSSPRLSLVGGGGSTSTLHGTEISSVSCCSSPCLDEVGTKRSPFLTDQEKRRYIGAESERLESKEKTIKRHQIDQNTDILSMDAHPFSFHCTGDSSRQPLRRRLPHKEAAQKLVNTTARRGTSAACRQTEKGIDSRSSSVFGLMTDMNHLRLQKTNSKDNSNKARARPSLTRHMFPKDETYGPKSRFSVFDNYTRVVNSPVSGVPQSMLYTSSLNVSKGTSESYSTKELKEFRKFMSSMMSSSGRDVEVNPIPIHPSYGVQVNKYRSSISGDKTRNSNNYRDIDKRGFS